MKESKGFLLLDVAVVVLVLGTLLLFVSYGFNGCVKNLQNIQNVREACRLSESFFVGEELLLPKGWQVQNLERSIAVGTLVEVQVLESARGKVLYNLLWVQ